MATQTPTASSRHEAINRCETSLLGRTYAGRPMRLALDIWLIEQAGDADKARALLDAHNRIRSAFGQQAYHLSADFTDLPMEGGFTVRAVPTINATPRPLNSRLWELSGKETARTISPAEHSELNALCARLEGAAA